MVVVTPPSDDCHGDVGASSEPVLYGLEASHDIIAISKETELKPGTRSHNSILAKLAFISGHCPCLQMLSRIFPSSIPRKSPGLKPLSSHGSQLII